MAYLNNARTKALAALVLTLIVLLSTAALAQGVLGSVSGVIRDTTGAVIPGANITLKSTTTGVTKTTTSNQEGFFMFPMIDNGNYVVVIERTGFKKATYDKVLVNPSQQYTLNATLTVGGEAQTIEVTAGQDLVNTASSDVAATVESEQILNLPLSDREPLELIRNQAGVPGIVDATRNATGINGGRPSWTQMSQDGINVQDNYIRTNAVNLSPNRATSDSIGEFSVVTNTPGADNVGGTSQVRMVTPAGGNAFHGDVYEYNRNSALAANDHWNKREGLSRDQLNLNQYGFKVSGPVLKNKLFFYTNYEAYRMRETATQNIVVPMHDDYLQGVYRKADGSTVNALALVNAAYKYRTGNNGTLGIDPTIKQDFLDRVYKSDKANSNSCPSGSPADYINRGCYSFRQGVPWNRDQVIGRFDYELNSKHHLEFVYNRYVDFNARNDIDFINPSAKASLSTNTKMIVGAWRWTVSPTLVNEVRMGDNTSVVPFLNGGSTPAWWAANNSTYGTLSGLNLESPDILFQNQGRSVTTRQYMDNASWTKGNHNITFGFNYMMVAPHTYNYASTQPTVGFGFSTGTANANYTLNSTVLTALRAADPAIPSLTSSQLTAINNLAAFLSGSITSVTQTFQAVDPTNGFVSGAPNRRRYKYEIYAPYFQDQWKLRNNLTITAGLKYEYWTPMTEEKGLILQPDMTQMTIQQSLLDPNGTVSFHKQVYSPDRMQFAPNVGFAWDPFKNGKTSIRGGYSLSFVNEDMVTALNNGLNGNFGLSGAVTAINLTNNITADGIPTIPTPAFQTSRTYLSQLTNSGATAAAWAIDPKLQTPYAHQFNFELQREVGWDTAVYARYVGTLGRSLLKGIDLNQNKAVTNKDYMADFAAAQYNYNLCGDIAVTPTSCSGAKAYSWFPTFVGGGYLTDPYVNFYVQTGQAAELANYYVSSLGSSGRAAARSVFLPNPNIYVADLMTNASVSNYHSLQLEARHNTKAGLSFQVNYTFSKLLSDSNGNSQNRFEPFLDNNNKHIDYSRSEYDLTHVINTNFIYQLPFGHGKKFLGGANGAVDRIVGGWSMSSIVRWQSGSPFSIYSTYGTLNRSGRSSYQGAYSPLTASQIKNLLGVKQQDGYVYWVNPSVLDPAGDGWASGPYDPLTYTPTFDGQAFYNPLAGTTGNLKKLQFDGPSAFNWDFSLAKKTKVTERVGTEFRMDFFNVLNRNNFVLWSDFNINSTNFGQITNSLPARRIQASMRVNF